MEHGVYWWIGFHLLILFFIWLDLKVLFPENRGIKVKEALWVSGLWVGSALLFNGAIFFSRGGEAALQFFTGYLVEKGLSLDNLFVFASLFAYFNVSPKDRHRMLTLGILAALIFRIIFILSGTALISHFGWVLYLLGVFLCYSGVKFMRRQQGEENLGQRWLFRWGKRWGLSQFTLVLLTIEGVDILFALDSIPAIFAITTDPFLIYTSNVFAILGMRSLFFVVMPFFRKVSLLPIWGGGSALADGRRDFAETDRYDSHLRLATCCCCDLCHNSSFF